MFSVLGTRLWVQGLGSLCWVLAGSGFRDWVLSAGFSVLGTRFWVQGLGSQCWVPGTGFSVLGTRFWVHGLGSQCWVLGSGFRDSVLSAGY